MSGFKSPFNYKLIYVFRIPDKAHKGLLKIGDATIETDAPESQLVPNCQALNRAAKKRIDEYTRTAAISYDLLYTCLAVRKVAKNGTERNVAFRDKSVHSVLERSGITKYEFKSEKKGIEWYPVDLETVKRAILAVQEGRQSLDSAEITTGLTPISFRPEQKKAIKDTIKNFKNSDRMLWNAKMRFGKTLTALQVVKELNFQKTLIFTHRPVVDDGWYEDFHKIFYDTDYKFGSKNKGERIENLVDTDIPFVYFASLQDLRGSSAVGGKFDKNEFIFLLDWDFVIIDEAHEGTQTHLGQKVIEAVRGNNPKKKPKLLELSGTPFNLLEKFNSSEVFTWDYIMEQKAKNDWAKEHFGDSNPYEELPQLQIYTYNLDKYIPGFVDGEDKAFNFREFFRTWTGDISQDYKPLPNSDSIGKFVHEDAVWSFLNIITRTDEDTNFPYANEEYRNYYRHTLWKVPGVAAAYALSAMLKRHPVFGSGAFKIVNVAGEGDDDEKSKDHLEMVRQAIGENPDDGYTITLSCSRLTTGVTVPEWTAVLMLAGSYSTSATNYMQTVFRVQSPANINGRIKEHCAVFDFAPDRTLKLVAEVGNVSSKAGSSGDRSRLGEFLNFCPVIAMDGSKMVPYDVDNMLRQLKRAYTDRVVKNGFDDRHIYSDKLLDLSEVELQQFEHLKKIVGKTKPAEKPRDIDMNDQGFDNERREEEEISRKPKNKRSPEEEARLQELKKRRENKEKAISVLRGISVRIPLLIYGADVDVQKEITVDGFPDIVDDDSWAEFMPKGVTKDEYRKFTKYYDQDIFVSAGKQVRQLALAADDLPPAERVQKIARIFGQFKNPDKETVLTPWRVVNMHMSKTLGGYNFYNQDFSDELDEPVFVDNGDVTKETLLNPNAKILEINSKTGLYPLYVVYSIYRSVFDKLPPQSQTQEKSAEVWQKVVENNMFVICKTPMAKSITKRTLLGYKAGKINAHYFEDLVSQLKNKPDQFKEKVTRGNYWGKKENVMKFDAVVGNPPYQGNNHQQIYPFFYLTSQQLGKYVSLIFPAGWQQPKNANNLSKMNNEKVKCDSQIHFIDNLQNVFPGISGAEWVNIIFWEKGYSNGLEGKQKIFTNSENQKVIELPIEEDRSKPAEVLELANIVNKWENFVPLSSITSVLKPYGLRTDVIENYTKYGLPPMQRYKQDETDICIWIKSGKKMWVPKDYPFPKKTEAFDKYKVLIPYAWGNMAEKNYLGGAFSDIIIAAPNEACTETYIESGCFDTFEQAEKHAKYLFTKFTRALLYVNKFSQHSTTAWDAIPVQDYSEDWWSYPLSMLDDKLFEKYSVPNEIIKYVKKNFQPKSEKNIINAPILIM